MKRLLFSVILSWAALAFGHGDHSVPGSIPPGLHGGFVKEAEHGEEENHGHSHGEESHDHGDEEKDHAHGKEPESKEKNLFIEAVYNASTKKLSLYPLVLETPASVLFTPVPVASVKVSSLKIEFPRTKKVVSVPVEVSASSVDAVITPGNAVRFIVHAEVTYGDETKVAKIQVETER